jgi:hypothetical protein
MSKRSDSIRFRAVHVPPFSFRLSMILCMSRIDCGSIYFMLKDPLIFRPIFTIIPFPSQKKPFIQREDSESPLLPGLFRKSATKDWLKDWSLYP